MINRDLLADMLRDDDENLNYVHYLDRSKLGNITKDIPGCFLKNTCILTEEGDIKEITVIPVIEQDLSVYDKEEIIGRFTIPGSNITLINIQY